MAAFKGPGQTEIYNGANLRIAIVHARWNTPIIEALVGGAKKKMLELGVKESNIVIESVPGSFELPFAVRRVYTASHVQAASVSSGASEVFCKTFHHNGHSVGYDHPQAHLDAGVPVVFGLLTVLTEEQGLVRAGMVEDKNGKRHNHGEDWGSAAVELGIKRRAWEEGKIG
ncbi:6,7-dimethyl-8-ribityllumazine synthase [Coccidioides immitis RMSCC 3703]|uniref:6,7-dimethyl-8-ribityllumazine synthase n=1 Tax=Coccidioides immitis RMSCC 3703 TaxID=454286 RepID=A0A0J8RAG9_COCIT|nr:6,7-dimethyl-8-ribityllumazine synthase [Coccidioides immitis RMSCC 3703]